MPASSRPPKQYVPDRGDLVWLDFTPHAGHEQGGRRPALVISPKAYHLKAGLMLACPVTSHVKGYPFEVAIPPSLPVTGVVLSDHLRSVDFRARRADFAGAAPASVLDEVVGKLTSLLTG
jgi:mRNA interferase MazF